MATRDHERLDRIVDRYAAKMPRWMARFVAWIRKPELYWFRLLTGVLLVLFGLIGFLPILGFWMVPLGLLLLAQDVTFLRRPTVNAIYWIERRIKAWRGRAAS